MYQKFGHHDKICYKCNDCTCISTPSISQNTAMSFYVQEYKLGHTNFTSKRQFDFNEKVQKTTLIF